MGGMRRRVGWQRAGCSSSGRGLVHSDTCEWSQQDVPISEKRLQKHYEESRVFLTSVVSLQVGMHQQHHLPHVRCKVGAHSQHLPTLGVFQESVIVVVVH